MKVRNRTTLKFARLMGMVNFPAPSVTCAVKGAFALVPGGVATLLDKQPEFEGDVLHKPSGSPIYEADLVPYKPRADLLLQATCYSPGGKAVTTLPVKFAVGAWSKELAVIGNRKWEKGLVFSKQGAADTFTQCEMHWGNAFGGGDFAENPKGKGHRDGQMPNIENPLKLIKGNGDTPHPAGFGPLDRQWKHRRGKVGTIDKKYLKERWPATPKDFDWSYFNAAPEDQQLEGFLRGDETIELQNLHSRHAELKCALPGIRVRCLLRLRHEGRLEVIEVPMNLDTVHVNAQTDVISLVWRGVQDTRLSELEDVEDFLIFSEPLSAPPLEHVAVMPWFEDPPAPVEPLPPPVFVAADPAGPGKALAAALEKGVAKLQAEMKAAVKLPAQTAMPANAGVFLGFAPLVASMVAMRSRMVSAGQQPPPNLDMAIREMQSPALAGAEADMLIAQAMAALVPAVKLKGASLAKAIRDRKTPDRDYSNQDLAGQDLSGLDLATADFRNTSLAGANLSGCKLDDCNFGDADLSGANLSAAKAERPVFAGANLSGANLEGCAFKEASFKMANVGGANLKGADLAGANFYRADLSSAVALGGKFDGGDFTMAKLDGADFTAASLAAATFFRATAKALKIKGAKAAGLRAPEAKLLELDAEEAELKNSVWELAQLKGANFRFAILEGALFNDADLSGAILFGATLRKGFLRKANMQGVMAGNADFFEANLERTNLRGASLVTSNCYGAALYQAETDGADFAQALVGNTILAKR